MKIITEEQYKVLDKNERSKYESIRQYFNIPLGEWLEINDTVQYLKVRTAYRFIELTREQQLQDALQKTVGILFNIRHETDYMPDSYYEWIDNIINEVDDLLPETE